MKSYFSDEETPVPTTVAELDKSIDKLERQANTEAVYRSTLPSSEQVRIKRQWPLGFENLRVKCE